eukprot:9487320-Lingulodinium_polyedra.AAC.1
MPVPAPGGLRLAGGPGVLGDSPLSRVQAQMREGGGEPCTSQVPFSLAPAPSAGTACSSGSVASASGQAQPRPVAVGALPP